MSVLTQQLELSRIHPSLPIVKPTAEISTDCHIPYSPFSRYRRYISFVLPSLNRSITKNYILDSVFITFL